MRERTEGKRVYLHRCTDEHTRKGEGDSGDVQMVDDAGTIHVAWDDGSRLGLLPQAGDIFDVVEPGTVRPLRRAPAEGCWHSRDGRYELCKHLSDPHPQRWFVYDRKDILRPTPPSLNASVPTDTGGGDPLNDGEGHVTLREVADWLERYVKRTA